MAAFVVSLDIGMKCPLMPDACTTATTACIDCSSAGDDPSCVDDNDDPITGCTMRDSFLEAALADEDASTYLEASCILKASEQAECEAPSPPSCSDDTSMDQDTCEAVSDCPDGDGGTTGSACVWGSEPSPCEFVAGACVPTAAGLAGMNMVWTLAHSSSADCPDAGCKCSKETSATILANQDDEAAMAAAAMAEPECLTCLMAAGEDETASAACMTMTEAKTSSALTAVPASVLSLAALALIAM